MLGSMKKESVNSSGTSDNAHVAANSWPVWSDTEINAGKWDATSARTTRDKSQSQRFEDPVGHCPLPPGVEVHSWHRALDVNPMFVVVHENLHVDDLDLVSGNHHLLSSPVVRHIVTSVMNLYHYAQRLPFEVEMQDNEFVANGGPMWRPWHHVYGSCKVGKGVSHNPQVNVHGKYFVRLYVLGAWRRITVDDVLPLDEHRRLLLPKTVGVTELWPMLLTKALLKVAQLTWEWDASFNAVVCLTGWMLQRVECRNVTTKFIWLVCQKMLMNRAEEDARYTSEPRDKLISLERAYSVSCSYSNIHRDPSIMDAMTSGDAEWMGDVMVLGEMNDVPEVLSDVGPCIAHAVLLTEARVIDVGDVGPIPLWKHFRWVDWALKKGIIKPDEFVHVKSVRLYSSLRKWLPPASEEGGEPVSDVVQLLGGRGDGDGDGKKGKSLKVAGETKSVTGKVVKEAMTKTSKTSIKSKSDKSSKKKDDVIIVTKENNDAWMDMNVFGGHLSSLQLFFRPSAFNHKFITHDATRMAEQGASPPSPTKTSSSKKSKSATPMTESKSPGSTKTATPATRNSVLEESGKLPKPFFYLLTDTMTCKKLFFTLSVVRKSGDEQVRGDRRFSVIVKQYDWTSIVGGPTLLDLTTRGARTEMVQLGTGQHVMKVWLDVPHSHSVTITSQSPFLVGGNDVILEAMRRPSVSLLHYGTELFDKFTAMSSVEPESAEHEQAVKEFRHAFLPPDNTHLMSDPMERFRLLEELEHTFNEVVITTLCQELDFDDFLEALTELQRIFGDPKFGLKILSRVKPEFENQIKILEEVKMVVEEKFDEVKPEASLKASSGKTKKTSPSTSLKSVKSKKEKKSATPTKQKVPSIFENQASSGIDIMLKIMRHLPHRLKLYPFHGDLQKRLWIADHRGSTLSVRRGWLPIARYTVNIDGDQPAHNSVVFSANVPASRMSVTNNDTLVALPQNHTSCVKGRFARNVLGYTIFAYSTVEHNTGKDVKWNMRLIADTKENVLHCCKPDDEFCETIPPSGFVVMKVEDHYIPNRSNTILKCVLTLKKDQIVSLRMDLSNQDVNVSFMILRDGEETVVFETKCMGHVTVPSLPLTVGDYLVEAKVYKKAWILSQREFELVNNIKEKEQKELMVFGDKVEQVKEKKTSRTSSKSRRTSSSPQQRRSSEESQILPGAAFWRVQVVVDADKEATTVFELNDRRVKAIRALKETWEAQEPGRQSRAAGFRQEFLNENSDIKFKGLTSNMTVSDTWRNQSAFVFTLQTREQVEEWRLLNADYRGEVDGRLQEEEGIFQRSQSEFQLWRAESLEQQRVSQEKFKEHYESVRLVSGDKMKAVWEKRDELVNALHKIPSSTVEWAKKSKHKT